ncbi:serine/threonine-protein kinase, partial [Mesorhizobium sp. B2-4-3]|uniref:serine/threonine-protein kinase n=1 Tax=Mesorhizobium sp. B2-4-3 TaxID=2589946 RepID=UPI00112BBA25
MQVIGGRFVVDPSWTPYLGEISKVVRAVDLQNGMAKVAIKIFDKDAFQQNIVLEAFARECESLQKLSAHDNIVGLIDLGRDADSGCSYLALEWCDANLRDHLVDNPERSWENFYKRYGADILDALRFAYSQDVLHRDIKPQNVLVNSEGRACLTDFGISKFRRYYRPGVTLVHFKSVPYAPPEDTSDFPDTRDVYSFAVLCLECIAGEALNDREAVVLAATSLQLPEDIREILIRCLSIDPAMRPANVVALAEEIEASTAKAVTLAAVTRDIPVHLTQSALEAMRVEGHLSTSDQAARQIFKELNEVCGIDELDGTRPQSDRQFALLTAEFRFRAVIDEARHTLTIIGLSHQNPSRLERQRNKAWQPLLRFIPATPRGDEGALEWLATEFDEFLTGRKVLADRQAESELFDQWSAALRAKEGIQHLRKEPIRFTSLEIEGTRLILSARHNLGEAITGQQRMIRLDQHNAIYGEIERTDGDTVLLYCGPGQNLSAVSSNGVLELDVRQSQIALKRQNAALDAVRFGRNTRPDLRDLLTGKKQPEVPRPPDDIVFFQPDLDDDKQAAVRAALGSRDLLVVEGPPGTGKTKFITELAAQVLSRTPGARILLSSQTHVALDHALVNIEKLAKAKGIALRAVRIARRNDEKVSPELSHLLLERCVGHWLEDAMQRSERFMIDWAAEHGITLENVQIGMALAELRLSTARLHVAQAEIDGCRKDLVDLEAERQEISRDRSRGDEYRVIVADIRMKQDEMTQLEEQLSAARHSFQLASDRARGFADLSGQIESMNEKDLADLEFDYINHSSHGTQYRKLLLLTEEWRQRFGQSSDFHGAFVSDCDLIAGTCLGVAAHALQSVEFDLCIVDEASKATPTEMLVPMAKSRKWVVVGDPNQLPPFVDDSLESRQELARHGIGRDEARRTLLDHFIDVAPKANQVSLLTQHRMVKPIGDLVSACFYNNTLKNVNENICPWLARAFALPKPVTWFTTAENSRRPEQFYRGTYVNDAEVEAIDRLLGRLQLAASQRKKKYSVALLSGYGGQVAALDRMAVARRRQLPDLDIETGTVDSYQGREADIAVYSITRSNQEGKIGFLKEHERLNVALSRAKLGLAIVGDSVFCGSVGGRNTFA